MAKANAYTQTFTNTTLDATQVNLIQSEGQAEWETRGDDLHADGCVGSSAWAPSIAGTQVQFASGVLYFRGRRYAAPAVAEFTGVDAGTYYVYVSHATGGLVTAAEQPAASAGHTLCSVAWSGSALSSLTDLRVVGTMAAAQIQWETVGGGAEDYQDVYLAVGEDDIFYVDHSDEVTFHGNPLPVAYTTQAGVELEYVAGADDDGVPVKTDGSGFLIRVRNVSCEADYAGSYDYPANATIRVFYERTGMRA